MSRLLVSIFALLVGGSCAGNIQPSKYTLQLLIDTEKDIFSGSLVIDAKVLAPTATNITLHSHGLNISSVSVTQQGDSSVYKSMAVSAEYQNVTISLTQNLNPNLNLKISLTYEGQVSTDEPTGLYTFMDSKKKFYITNLYPIHARKLFPCVDTPEAAAQMALTVIVTKANGNLTASTPITKVTSLSNGYTQYEVDTTIDIAPYSLFFTIGDWSSDSYTLPSPRSLLWLPPSLVSQIGKIDPNLLGALTTSYIPFVLEGFINHLNIFVVPALEDDTYSGLNTVVLRNDVLINNVGETTTEQHKEHLLKIAYAVWKMFWGTATRPAGWGNNWLTTSVPMYLAYSILDEPNWAATYGNSDENLVSGLYEKVFETCSDIDSPVSYMSAPPTNPRDILSFVRSSGIEKGLYALKTIETFVDPALIRSSLPTYIVQKNNSAIDTHSFLDMLGESTKSTVNLTQVILPILSQPGYPLVSVDRNAGTLDMLKANFVKVQTKSPTFGGQFSQLADAQSWLLPVTATTSQSPNSSKVYFLDAQAKVITGYFPSEGWALLNLDGKGIMRTSYDYTSWSILASASKTFSTATRAKLVADAFATAESNVQPSWTGTLKFLEVLDVETHLAPWKNALAGFKRMWSWIYYTGSPGNTNSTGQINLVDPFKAYVKARLTNLYTKLGPVGDNRDPQDFLRREIVAAMCDYGDSTCLQNLNAQYKNMNDGGSQPSNDLFSVVVCNGLRTADIDSWTKAFNKYAFGGVSYPKDQLKSHYNFLACSDSTDVIEKFLQTVLLNPQGNFPQEQIIPAVSEILDKPQHVDQVLNYFIEHQQTFNLSTGVQAELVMNIGKRLTSPTQTNLLAQFKKQHSQPSDINDAISKAIVAGNAKAQYILSIQGQVQSALRGEAPTTTSPSTGSSSGSSGTPPLTTPTTVPPPQTTTPGKASATAVSLLALMATAFALAAQ